MHKTFRVYNLILAGDWPGSGGRCLALAAERDWRLAGRLASCGQSSSARLSNASRSYSHCRTCRRSRPENRDCDHAAAQKGEISHLRLAHLSDAAVTAGIMLSGSSKCLNYLLPFPL